jgi:hypothetical protein
MAKEDKAPICNHCGGEISGTPLVVPMRRRTTEHTTMTPNKGNVEPVSDKLQDFGPNNGMTFHHTGAECADAKQPIRSSQFWRPRPTSGER